MLRHGRCLKQTARLVSRRYISDFHAMQEAFMNDLGATSAKTSKTFKKAPTAEKPAAPVDPVVSTASSGATVESSDPSQGPISQFFESSLNDYSSQQVEGSHNWSETFHGLANQAFPKEAQQILAEPIPDNDIEITPDGLLYLPEIKYRRILNRAFGPGAWGLAPRSETLISKSGLGGLLTREYGLVIHGRLVSIARGEQTFFSDKGIPTATEGCKSNALMRCCKDLGIASELWDPRFIKQFKKKNCEELFVEYIPTKKKKKIWKRKDEDVEYPFKK
ncbi:hypothetical protein KL909_000450 [Ogataea angusta]|nr:hypothetical protein KL909_000450 [Ogataea angusta]